MLLALSIIKLSSFVSDLKIVSYKTINPRSQFLGQERKIFCVTTYLDTKSFITVSK